MTEQLAFDDISMTRTSRADQIFARFRAYHEQNPTVWVLFKRFTLESIRRGHKHGSVDLVIQLIRWEVPVDTEGDIVKINNDFRAYYARMFMAAFPEHNGFFELRKRTSADRRPFAVDIPVAPTGPPENEDALMATLRELGI